MSNNLSVGFFRFDSSKPLTAAVPLAPPPGSWTTVTIGGPETREQIIEKIEACEKTLAQLRAQLESL